VSIFLVGASAVIGRPLVPRLVGEGHEVTGMTRTPEKADAVRALGAEPVVCDVLDAERLREAVTAARPDVVVQHLTDVPQDLNPRNIKRAYEANDRTRSEGTKNLIAAASVAGARRFVAQNISFVYAPEGGAVKDEDAPIMSEAPRPFDRSLRGYEEMERRILEAPGMESLILRCGFWYGPGTTYAHDGFTAREVRRRRFPVVGRGSGVFSFVHVDDVVEATVLALERGSPGIYNVADDEPAPMSEWLPYYADVLGAKPPRRVPAWLARLVVPGFIVYMATEMRGASNANAKRELGWSPRHPSWRAGFRDALG
jgi:nucleoside-diphosphate-sugar epimerase